MQTDSLWVLEANLDDLSPQLVEVFIQQSLARGALDAWATPIVMKKGRPGLLLSALCREELKASLIEVFFRETSTLGVRVYPVERFCLERLFRTVETQYGTIRIKLGMLGDEIVNAHPEFEECRAAAALHHAPVKQVIAIALATFWSQLASQEK
jgi:pyridinium-3,5-bisthiocarboxylic acid mononucleotide nickel chelatase